MGIDNTRVTITNEICGDNIGRGRGAGRSDIEAKPSGLISQIDVQRLFIKCIFPARR